MSLENIAVSGCTVAHAAGSTGSGGVFVVTSSPSIKVIATAGVYKTPLSVTFSGGTFPGLVPGTVIGTGTISAIATKTKADGLPVMREGDTGTMTGTGTLPPPAVGTGPATGPIEIASAGQAKVKAQ